MRSRLLWVALSLPFLGLVCAPTAGAAPGYCRYPDIHGERIVFSAEGDLWMVGDHGGIARRVTTNPGNEQFARFSPDGKWVAFSGDYNGNRDVFVIPADGGEPRRLTWHPGSDEVTGWTADGASVIFRSRSLQPMGEWELFRVAVTGGDAERLPLGWAARIDVDAASGLWAFTRSSTETFTWKRYRGGTQQDIWVGDPAKADFRQVTHFAGTDGFPMWHGGLIYFTSDEGGTMNIWSMNPDGSDRTRLTDFKDWDARWPGMGPDGRIVFVLGGDLHLFNPADRSVRKIETDLPSDRVLTRVRYPDAAETMTGFDIAPKGDRLVVASRGELFSVPVKKGITIPLTGGSGARESSASFDGKGERIVYITDASHEEEVRTLDAWGRGDPKTVVKPAGTGWHFPPVWSPDGKWIAWADETNALWVAPADATGEPKLVDRGMQGEISEYVWSFDGRWLAYANGLPSDYSAIFIYDTQAAAGEKPRLVTTPTTSNTTPAWDPDGRYLYYMSDRVTNPIIGSRDFESIELKSSRPYFVILQADGKNPFAELEGQPPEPEEKPDAIEGAKTPGMKPAGKKSKEKEADKTKKSKGKGDKKGKDDAEDSDEDAGEDEVEPVKIDWDGLSEREVALPVPPGLYAGLAATARTVFFLSLPIQGFAEQADLFEEEAPVATLMAFNLEDKTAEPFQSPVSGFALAARAGKIAVAENPGELYVLDADAPAPEDLTESAVSLDGIVLELDPREEWAQIYYESWRETRDFFWDPNMGGVDWKGVRDRYATLLPRLSSRSDLTDLIGEVIGEANNSHTYVFGGDPGQEIQPVSTGMLGAELVRDGDAYKIARLLRADAADLVRSPLSEPGVNVKEGDYILKVNRKSFAKGRPVESAFEGLAGVPVLLTVNGKNSPEGAREVVVTPVPSDATLRYSDWVRTNREYVAKKTDGKIGYVHIPDMWKDGMIAFNTWFYPQLDKEGMVVDVRWNGGGAVSQLIIQKLSRSIVSFDRPRYGDAGTYPYRTLNGPFVVLTNEFAGSDGDIFPAAVQILKLAPVIGERSWGGVVGIRGDKGTVDGGLVTHPEFAWWDFAQGWGLENRGVIPDIELQNLPQDLARGVDAQLDRAIAEVMSLREKNPPRQPDFGPVPGRSREDYRKREMPASPVP